MTERVKIEILNKLYNCLKKYKNKEYQKEHRLSGILDVQLSGVYFEIEDFLKSIKKN